MLLGVVHFVPSGADCNSESFFHNPDILPRSGKEDLSTMFYRIIELDGITSNAICYTDKE
jgi:hypothetical protein